MKITTELLNQYYQYGKVTNITEGVALGTRYKCYHFKGNDELGIAHCAQDSDRYRDANYNNIVLGTINKIYEIHSDKEDENTKTYFVLFNSSVRIHNQYLIGGNREILVKGMFLDGGGYLLENKEISFTRGPIKVTLKADGIFYTHQPGIKEIIEILGLKNGYILEEDDDRAEYYFIRFFCNDHCLLLNNKVLLTAWHEDYREGYSYFYFKEPSHMILPHGVKYNVNSVKQSHLDNLVFIRLAEETTLENNFHLNKNDEVILTKDLLPDYGLMLRWQYKTKENDE